MQFILIITFYLFQCFNFFISPFTVLQLIQSQANTIPPLSFSPLIVGKSLFAMRCNKIDNHRFGSIQINRMLYSLWDDAGFSRGISGTRVSEIVAINRDFQSWISRRKIKVPFCCFYRDFSGEQCAKLFIGCLAKYKLVT